MHLVALLVLQTAVATATDPLEGHPGIGNYYRVRPDVATAGQPTDEALADVQKAGFKAVLNLRTEQEGSLEEKPKVEALGLKYYNIPIGSDGISKEQVALFSEILEDAKNRPLLIHCASSNRVGALWYIHEVLSEGKDEASALEEAKKAGLKSLEQPAKDYVAAVSSAMQILPDVPDGAQAMSLLGKPLHASEPSPKALADFEKAKAEYEADPNGADSIIWYGRRAGYLGDYRAAIRIFSEGIEKHPQDARMYRHRGHRYISIREFDRAIADLERAATLIDGTENVVEPDGAPNARNIPLSSLHGNVWYHLGLAYYLKHDWANALRAYQNGFDVGRNDDNRVSTTHWRFSILRRMGKPDDARKVLDAITADMNIIENTSYHRLCLFYKGELRVEDIMPENDDDPANAAIAYGVANWFLTEGNEARAREIMEDLVASSGWAGFGAIAAEADLAVW